MILGFPRIKKGLCHTKHGGAGGIILWALLTVFLFCLMLFAVYKIHNYGISSEINNCYNFKVVCNLIRMAFFEKFCRVWSLFRRPVRFWW